jgi:hypothetical protein
MMLQKVTIKKMAKFIEGIIDVLVPGLISGGGNAFGNPLEAPWGDSPPPSVSDADGTRTGDTPRQPPLWWGPYDFPPPTGRPISMVPPPSQMQSDPAGDGGPPQSSETYQQGADRRDRERSGARNNARNELRERLLREQREKEQQDDFLQNRRVREQQWRESKEANDVPPPRGVLLPFEDDDWDLDADPNETDAERDSRRQRSDILRRGQQAAITLAGGASAGAIYNTWKDRTKWVLKNSGTIQGRKYPPPPIIPVDGPGDLNPPISPDDPIPAQPVPRAPIERTVSGWIQPVDNIQRAVFFQNDDEMDCSCD